MQKIFLRFFLLFVFLMPCASHARLASRGYVDSIVSSIKTTTITSESTDEHVPTAHAVWDLSTTISSALSDHVSDTGNPHSVSSAQVGLGNVKNVDTTNASNITSGTLSTDRLPVGTTSGTVASGDDARFFGVPRGRPTGDAPEGMVWMWFE